MDPSCLELKDVMTVDWDTTSNPSRAKWDGGGNTLHYVISKLSECEKIHTTLKTAGTPNQHQVFIPFNITRSFHRPPHAPSIALPTVTTRVLTARHAEYIPKVQS